MKPVMIDSDAQAKPVTTSVEDSETELKLVHIIFRHGDRTPDYPYLNDPHKSHTYAPYGHGQLTKAGYNRLFNTGKFLRQRYDSFLGPPYKQSEIHAQSTGVPRARMSLQLLCAGLFPPVNTDLEWNGGLNWQPVDFTYVPGNEDSLLLPIGTPCSKLLTEMTECYAPVLEKNKELFETLSEFIGRPIKSVFDVIGLYQLLTSQVECGLELPAWTKPYYPEKLRELSCESWGRFVQTSALKRMLGGNLLEKLTNDWKAQIEKKSSKKLFLYSAHDSTVVSILGACNVWNNSKMPEYGCAVIFELRQNKTTGQYGVQVYFRNDPEDEPELLTIPGCESFCTIDEFKKVLGDHFPSVSE